MDSARWRGRWAALASTVLLAVAVAGACPAPAGAVAGDGHDTEFDLERWTTLDGYLGPYQEGRGDKFLTFDANWQDGPKNSSAYLDWPVNLIFVSQDEYRNGERIISTSLVKEKLKEPLAPGIPAFTATGGQMHELLRYWTGSETVEEWDVDRGVKEFETTCDADTHAYIEGRKDDNYHFRVYGPMGEHTLYHPDYGHFVVATSHVDHRENCPDHWSGRSETAEKYFASVFAAHGFRVEPDKIYLANETPADGEFTSNGYATVIHLDETTPVTPPNGAPRVDAGPDVSGDEGAAIALQGVASDDDYEVAPPVHWSYTAGADTDPGAACAFSREDGLGTTFRCTDDGTYTVTLSADDGRHGGPSTDSAVVHVANVAPQVQGEGRGIGAPRPWAVHRVGEPVLVSTLFEDPGANDTQTCQVAWDDGSTTAGEVGEGTCRATHTYRQPGMYTIEPTVTDDDGGASAPIHVLVIGYDPTGGWVNADGSFDSLSGALRGSPGTAGEVWFHLAAHYYPQDPTRPAGSAATWLAGADYRLQSAGSTLDWLVVTPDGKVAAMGRGTLAGHPGRYGFVFYAYDGCAGAERPDCRPGLDRFRSVVWPLDDSPFPALQITYDNRNGVDYDLDRAGPDLLRSGSVLVQRPA